MTAKVVPLVRVQGRAEEMSDDALLAACAVGDTAALGALFDRHADAVRGFLVRMAGTDDRDIDDLVQATFETVFASSARFGGRSAVKTWIFGIANNIVRRHVRTERRRKRAMETYSELPRPSERSSADEAMDRESHARLKAAIAALPPKLRETFVLVYLESLPGREVAELLGVREGTIWKRLHLARARLREALEGVGR